MPTVQQMIELSDTLTKTQTRIFEYMLNHPEAEIVFVNSTAKDGMGIWIAVCCGIPSAVDEVVTMLGCNDGIQHNG